MEIEIFNKAKLIDGKIEEQKELIDTLGAIQRSSDALHDWIYMTLPIANNGMGKHAIIKKEDYLQFISTVIEKTEGEIKDLLVQFNSL